MVAMLQQKSTVTLTLIHAASTPPCIDLPLNCTQSPALTAMKCTSKKDTVGAYGVDISIYYSINAV